MDNNLVAVGNPPSAVDFFKLVFVADEHLSHLLVSQQRGQVSCALCVRSVDELHKLLPNLMERYLCGSGGNNGILTDGHTWQDGCTGSNPGISCAF